MDSSSSSLNNNNEVPDPLGISNSMDIALLESLFYNEMASLDDESLLSGLINIPETTADAVASVSITAASLNSPKSTKVGESMAGVVSAETDLLRDFGVASPLSTDGKSAAVAQPQKAQASRTKKEAASKTPAPPFVPPPITAQQQANQRLASGRGIRHSVQPKAQLAVSQQPQQKQQQRKQPQQQPSSGIEDEKHKKLVAQFATLAGRLGITLPPQVLQKLTAAKQAQLSSSVPVAQVTVATAPSIQQIQSTAAEAIAAVSNKRPASSISSGSAANANTNNTNSNNSSDPAAAAEAAAKYSKRRKKPRLQECERRLSELQGENALLKRHLENINNSSAKLDEERVKAETQMRSMLQTNAPDKDLTPVVLNFTEMYSDYGRKRHQELSFHLEQLRRLANPTNFTKMGLWTLGGQSKEKGNPIAGMLQKELGITQQQGRKILEQRQKIQNVCSNLKECLVLLGKLNALCEQKTKIFHDRMTKCREILTPKQVVQLLIWIDENSQTLGSVCPGWGSEQMQSKIKPKIKEEQAE